MSASDLDVTDSEEDENLERCKEAVVDTTFLNFGAKTGSIISSTSTAPSKRPDKEKVTDEDVDDVFHTTPGFKKHVARKFSEALDSMIDTSGTCFGPINVAETEILGIKLFASSNNYVNGEDNEVKVERIKRKPPPSSSSDDSSEDERLAEASVSHDFVVKQSRISLPSNDKPADIILKVTDEQSNQSNVTNDKMEKFGNDEGRSSKKMKIDFGEHKHLTKHRNNKLPFSVEMETMCKKLNTNADNDTGSDNQKSANACKKKKKHKRK